MATKIEKKPLAGRDGDGTLRGGSPRIPSLAADIHEAPGAGPAANLEAEPVADTRRPAVLGHGAMITVPLAEANPNGNVIRNINARLDRHQAVILRRLRMGLEDSGAKLRNGSAVSDNSKVIRWLLEQIGSVE